MSKQYYPDNFLTQLDGNAMTVTTQEGEVLAAYSIKPLADGLIMGTKTRLDAGERAMVGACLLHLLDLDKNSEIKKPVDLPDGIYPAETLEAEEESQAKAVADSVKLSVEAFYAINNADFCDDRMDEALIQYQAQNDWPDAYVKVPDLPVYDLIQVRIDGVEVWIALDGIGGFVRKRDLSSLLLGKV